jgi:hypothetical protein
MPRPRKLTIDEPHVTAGYQSGMNLRELASLFNTSPGTIRATLLRNNVSLRHRGRKTRGDK